MSEVRKSEDFYQTYLKQLKGKKVAPRDLIQIGVSDKFYPASFVAQFFKLNHESEKFIYLDERNFLDVRSIKHHLYVSTLSISPIETRYTDTNKLQANWPEVKDGKKIDRWFYVPQTFLMWF